MQFSCIFALLIPAFALAPPPPKLTLAASPVEATLPYPCLTTCLSFGSRLEPPYIIGARTHRPVSCYALFKWWLLLSQHPGCLCTLTSFHTESAFRGLSWRSGLFPSRQRSLSPAVSLPSSDVSPFGV